MTSKEEYLKRYLSGPVSSDTSKKKLRKKDKSNTHAVKQVAGLRILDDDVDLERWRGEGKKVGRGDGRQLVSGKNDEDFEFADEKPTVAQFIDERPEKVKQLEAYRESKKWKQVESDSRTDDSRKSRMNVKLPQISRRHDSSPDTSPQRKRVRHDSSPDNSPIRQQRHDSDGDNSPPRKRHDSDNSPPRRKENDSDNSLPRQNRNDSDNSPVRRKRNDSDNSPPRRKRNDSDSDNSPPRKRKNSDSDNSPPRKRKNSDSDNSPPRKRKNSDSSPPRKDSTKDKSDQVVFAMKTMSGASAGLQSAKDMAEEARKLKAKEELAFSKMDDRVLGRNAQVVHRDRKTGRRRDTEAENREKEEKEKKKKELEAKYAQWNKGLKQGEVRQANIEDALHEMSKPLARSKDDKDLDALLRNRVRTEEVDPMAAFIKPKNNNNKPGSTKPRYSGRQPPPNRFNIWPGYRWDGVDRSNGFEKLYFSKIAERKVVKDMAHKWSVEDM